MDNRILWHRKVTGPTVFPAAGSSLLRCFLAITLTLFALAANAETNILLLSSGEAGVYRRVAESIDSSLKSICSDSTTACPGYRLVKSRLSASDTPFLTLKRNWDLIVTIGVKAAKSANKQVSATPKLYTLIPEISTRDFQLTDQQTHSSALFLDQPIVRQMNLIKLIKPDDTHLAILLGPTTKQLQPLLNLAAKSLGITPYIEVISNDDEVGPALRRALSENDVLLALPDPLIYNKNTIFNILLSSYHNQIPVVGFSASYVRAGALLAVYSKPEQVGLQIAETLEYFIRNKQQLPPPAYPNYFSIEVNRSVSRSLGFTMPDDDELTDQLKGLEGR